MRRDEENSPKTGVDDDYLDLLRDFNKKASAPRNETSRDIYSDSSYEKGYKRPVDNGGIYIGKPKNDNYDDYGYYGYSVNRPHNNNRYEDVYSENQTDYEDETSDYEDIRSKNRKKRKAPIAFIAVFLVFAIVFLSCGYVVISALGVVGKFKKAEEPEHYDGELISEKNVTNILLIGLDKDKGGSQRSDSIIICSVNKETGKVTLTSVLRDTHLLIPGNDEAKVNSAYSWGGAELLVQTIEMNFGIKIDEYAAVDFGMFTELIDALGGVDVEITEEEADYLNNGQDYKKEERPDGFESGKSVHINGYQALWYSRIRYLDSDFMRTKRQRKVITAIVNKAKSKLTPAGILSLIDTGKAVAPFVETTLSRGDLISLVMSAVSCLVKNGKNIDELLVSQKIPFEDTWYYEDCWDGSSIAIDLEENKEILYNTVYKGEVLETEE